MNMKPSIVRRPFAASVRLLLAGLGLFSIPFHADAQAPVCKALVSANNQLYLVAEDGVTIVQFPTDTQSKSSISLSPDGTKVAYVADASPNAFTVVDTSGRQMSFPVPPSAQGTFTGVTWDSANALKVRYHAGRDNDVFQFYLATPGFSYPLPKIGRAIAGVNCSIKSDEGTTACLSENKLVVNKKILIDRDPLSTSNVSSFTSANLVVGTSLVTQTSPSFQIRVQEIAGGEVGLMLTLPDGSWSKSRVPVGMVMPVAWDDVSYGFSPVSVDRAKGQVAIAVTKSSGHVGTFDPSVAWSSNNHVAVVTHGSTGAQLLLVKASGNEAPMSAALGEIDQVTSISFETPTQLMLRTATQFLSVPIHTINGKSSNLQIGAVRRLPISMSLTLPGGATMASVEGWTCR